MLINFHAYSSEDAISAGQDATIRHNITRTSYSSLLVSVVENKMEKSSVEKNKMPPILKFKTEEARDKNRDCHVNLHQGTDIFFFN